MPEPEKTDPPKKDEPDENEAQWAALEERTKKATRATLDEWWEERKAEAKKSGGGFELDFGPIGNILGFKTKTK